jgi:hypothetical protein
MMAVNFELFEPGWQIGLPTEKTGTVSAVYGDIFNYIRIDTLYKKIVNPIESRMIFIRYTTSLEPLNHRQDVTAKGGAAILLISIANFIDMAGFDIFPPSSTSEISRQRRNNQA